MKKLSILAAVAVLAVASLPAQAGGQIFTDEERHIIREVLSGVEHLQSAIDGPEERTASGGGSGKKKKHYNKDGGGYLPPGLAKRDGNLPPGLERQLEKNGRLPPGLAKRALPDELHHRLGPPRKGTRRYIVNEDVVLIEEATGVILDIIENAFGD